MKATEQYFPVVLFIMLYEVVVTFKSFPVRVMLHIVCCMSFRIVQDAKVFKVLKNVCLPYCFKLYTLVY